MAMGKKLMEGIPERSQVSELCLLLSEVIEAGFPLGSFSTGQDSMMCSQDS
jgi:hypothetical protein